MNNTELLEKLASLEHDQWMRWAKDILRDENISSATRERWESSFIPYGELSDDLKELDREFARKTLKLLENS